MNELVSLNQIVSEIKFFENQATESFWEIGKRLSIAREQVNHGEWMNWVSSNLGYSYDTTNNLIKVYKEFPNFDANQNLGFQKMLSLTSIKDEDERQDFIDKHEVEDMTTRKLQDEIKKYKRSLEETENKLNETVKEKDEEIGKLRVSNNSLYGELQIEKSRSPEVIEKEVIKEIVPDDYELTKAQLENANKRLEKLMQVNQSLKDKEKLAMSKLESEQANKKIVEDVSGFHYKIAGFIQEVGGLLYLTEYLDDIPKENKKLFLDSARYLREFSEQLYKNIEGYINQNQKG